MALEKLQTAIDASLRDAAPLIKELFGEGGMDATGVRDFINDTMSVSVATVSRSGRPHAALTLCACSADGEIYFAANQRSALYRNLQRSPYVALTVDARERGLMAQGRAELVGLAPYLRERLLPELDRLMQRGRWLPENWDGAVFRVQINRIFAR